VRKYKVQDSSKLHLTKCKLMRKRLNHQLGIEKETNQKGDNEKETNQKGDNSAKGDNAGYNHEKEKTLFLEIN